MENGLNWCKNGKSGRLIRMVYTIDMVVTWSWMITVDWYVLEVESIGLIGKLDIGQGTERYWDDGDDGSNIGSGIIEGNSSVGKGTFGVFDSQHWWLQLRHQHMWPLWALLVMTERGDIITGGKWQASHSSKAESFTEHMWENLWGLSVRNIWEKLKKYYL